MRQRTGVIADPLIDADFMHQIYTAAQPDYTGRVTVPVLWDKQTGTIVNNESAEIIQMFNTAFDDIGALPGDYFRQACALRWTASMSASITA